MSMSYIKLIVLKSTFRISNQQGVPNKVSTDIPENHFFAKFLCLILKCATLWHDFPACVSVIKLSSTKSISFMDMRMELARVEAQHKKLRE